MASVDTTTTPARPAAAPDHVLRRTATSAVALLVLAVLAAAAWQVIANGYAERGYWRTIVLVLATATRTLAPWVLGLTLLGGLIAAWMTARRGDAVRAFALGTGVAIAAGALLRVGYVFNRYHVDVNWSWMRRWHGLEVPGFLWERTVLLQNAGLLIGAGVAGWLLYRATWWAARRSPRLRRGVTRALDAWHGALVAALLIVAMTAFAGAVRRPADGAPSFLVISLDTLRADHLGCYGYPLPTSPAIDSLAAESVLFEWTISQAEATLPSHMSIFTSLLPSSHGVWNYRYELPPRFLTLPEVLREGGYRTAAFVDAGHMLGLFGFSQGFDVYHDRFERLEGSVRRSLDWLDGVGADEPFFLFVHGYDIHTPYSPWSPYRPHFVDPAYDGGFEPTVKAMGEIGWAARHDPDYVAPLSEADVAYIVACYDAAIRWADDLVARLLDGLAQRGRLEDTWIVVLSDHGEEFLEHGSVEHDKLYHTVTHVPLIIRAPGPVPDGAPRDGAGGPRGLRVGDVTSLVDVFPTICELAGIPVPPDLAGRSLVPYLEGETLSRPGPHVAYSQSWRFGHERAITADTLHAISSLLGQRPLEVFAYRRDRLEQHPLNAGVAEPDSATRAIGRRLVEWMKETGVTMDENVARRLLGSEFETLRNLGYIQ